MNYPLYPADPNRDPAEPFRNLDSAPTTRPVATIEPRPEAWDDVIDAPSISTEELVELPARAIRRGEDRLGVLRVAHRRRHRSRSSPDSSPSTGVVLGLDVRNPLVFARELPLDLGTVGWIARGRAARDPVLAYYCGGYVAGRMARFSGVAQGIAVWVWTIAIAIVAAVVAFVLGRFDAPPARTCSSASPSPRGAPTIPSADHRGHRARGRRAGEPRRRDPGRCRRRAIPPARRSRRGRRAAEGGPRRIRRLTSSAASEGVPRLSMWWTTTSTRASASPTRPTRWSASRSASTRRATRTTSATRRSSPTRSTTGSCTSSRRSSAPTPSCRARTAPR